MGKLTVKQCDGAKAQGKRVMREKALGAYPDVSLAEARRLHSEQSESVKTGKLASL